ncbi:MAG: NAD-dependent epimerase/dehydratase family protein [Halieaceae bacterium]
MVEALVAAGGTQVWVFDNLHPQVHGPDARIPPVPESVKVLLGDVRDKRSLDQAFLEASPTCVVHLAAETGTGQSKHEIRRYCDVNVSGTANVLECMRDHRDQIRRLVLPSSRAVYGEGLYCDASGNEIVPPARDCEAMTAGDFLLRDDDGEPLHPQSTREDVMISPASIYGSTKYMQELLAFQAAVGETWDPVVFRFQNVYGPGQSLTNPYTGVLSIFCAQALQGQTLNVYEDGEIVRDFVYVDDVVAAIMLGAGSEMKAGVYNVGSGQAVSIRYVAESMLRLMGLQRDSCKVSGDFRDGDIRHAVADISRIESATGWRALTTLEDGLERLIESAKISLRDREINGRCLDAEDS